MDPEEIMSDFLEADDAAVPTAIERDGELTVSKTETRSVPDTHVTQPQERETNGEQGSALPQTLARLTENAEAVTRTLAVQSQRIDEIGREIQDVAGALLSQMADLETQGQQAAKAVEAHAVQSIGALTVCFEAAENAQREAERRAAEAEAHLQRETRRQDAYKQAWQSAPLTLRLKFVREILPDSHALQNVLKEAAALEELRRRGHDLETWLINYPALFADAAQALVSGGSDDAPEHPVLETDPAGTLASQALHEAQAALETTVQALGITWVAPAPGDAVLTEYEVIGEESSGQNAGSVARLRRRGFRFQGRLALPAQVLRSAAPATKTQVFPALVEVTNSATPDTLPAKPAEANDLPDWLRMLSQRTFGCDLPAVSSLAEQVVALNDLPTRLTGAAAEEAARKVLTDALQPLLPLLGLRYADGLPDIPEAWGAAFLEVREPLLAWLAERIGLALVSPARGEGFEPQTMEALETRRTVHANEDETVAKLERIGLLWRGRPLIRAQVVRYSIGGNP